MSARTRKAIGVLILLIYLAAYIALAATLGGWAIANAPFWAAAIFFLIAGVIWVFPLRGLMHWMGEAD